MFRKMTIKPIYSTKMEISANLDAKVFYNEGIQKLKDEKLF